MFLRAAAILVFGRVPSAAEPSLSREGDNWYGEQQQQQFFVGGMGQGGGGSGQNVLDPTKFMEQAQREMGAVSHSEHEASRGNRAFMGSGYSLSGQGGDPVVKNDDPSQIKHTITFWKNGFSVDDGPLRTPEDPANADFLRDINQGRVPREFGGEKDPLVSIISRLSEDFQAPAAGARPRAFQGEGQTLGGSSAPATSSAAAGPVQTPAATVKVDESEPVTTIQIRMHDGTRVTQRFNLTDTVGSIYSFVASATPGVEFDLNMSFPRKKLDDKSATIADSQLQNAAITQSLK